jgi:hypothetical protein
MHRRRQGLNPLCVEQIHNNSWSCKTLTTCRSVGNVRVVKTAQPRGVSIVLRHTSALPRLRGLPVSVILTCFSHRRRSREVNVLRSGWRRRGCLSAYRRAAAAPAHGKEVVGAIYLHDCIRLPTQQPSLIRLHWIQLSENPDSNPKNAVHSLTLKDTWHLGRQVSHLSVQTRLDSFFKPALLSSKASTTWVFYRCINVLSFYSF